MVHYGYYDYISGAHSEINANMDEVLWKKQLLQSCDREIFIEKEHKFLDIQELLFRVSNIKLKSNEKQITSSITLISDYDSLREYERVYTTTKSKQQEKRLESFIRVGNKWLNIETASYNFADLEKKSEEELVKLNTKELPMEFRDKIVIYVQDQYRLYFLGANASERFPIHSNELIGILKKAHVPEEAKIIIKAPPEILFESLICIMDLLRQFGYNSLALSEDTSYFSQDSLYKYNENIKTKLERDINIGFASLNRDVCTIQSVSFAIDSLNSIYILPKYVYVKSVDYELIKHHLIQSIQANYDSLQLKKNWAYCMDLVVCTENAIRE
jgi:biopolymer transport protein ExbD